MWHSSFCRENCDADYFIFISFHLWGHFLPVCNTNVEVIWCPIICILLEFHPGCKGGGLVNSTQHIYSILARCRVNSILAGLWVPAKLSSVYMLVLNLLRIPSLSLLSECVKENGWLLLHLLELQAEDQAAVQPIVCFCGCQNLQSGEIWKTFWDKLQIFCFFFFVRVLHYGPLLPLVFLPLCV